MQPPAGLDFTLMVAFGLTSSLHCVTMCGPLIAVASAPLLEGGGTANARRLLLWQGWYHLGRGISYALIGTLLGLLGTAITVVSPNKLVGGIVQVGVGLLIVGLGLAQLVGRGGAAATSESGLSRAIRRLVTSGHGLGMLGLGLLTGLLPCGVLYAAFARAMAASSPWEGGLLLIAFWLGTVPLLAAVGLASGKLVAALGRHATVLLFAAMLATGGWLTVKGYRNLTAPPVAAAAAPSAAHEPTQ